MVFKWIVEHDTMSFTTRQPISMYPSFRLGSEQLPRSHRLEEGMDACFPGRTTGFYDGYIAYEKLTPVTYKETPACMQRLFVVLTNETVRHIVTMIQGGTRSRPTSGKSTIILDEVYHIMDIPSKYTLDDWTEFR